MIDVVLVVHFVFQVEIDFLHGVAENDEPFLSHIHDIFVGSSRVAAFGARLKDLFSRSLQKNDFFD